MENTPQSGSLGSDPGVADDSLSPPAEHLSLAKQPPATPKSIPAALATSGRVLKDEVQRQTQTGQGARSHIPELPPQAASGSQKAPGLPAPAGAGNQGGLRGRVVTGLVKGRWGDRDFKDSA